MNERLQARVAIAGVGNVLMTDDGVGVHAVRALQQDPPVNVTLLDVGTAVLHGVDLLAGAGRLVLVDAVVGGGGQAGAIYVLRGADVREAGDALSLHAVGLLTALRHLGAAARQLEAIVVGVEPQVVAYGTELSAAVEEALPTVVRTVRKLVENWTCAAAEGGAIPCGGV